MSLKRVGRRGFLIGAGGLSIALPTLSYFQPRKTYGQDATGRPKFFLTFLNAQGTLDEQWLLNPADVPDVMTDDPRYQFGDITSPLDPWKARLLSIWGVDNKMPHLCRTDGHLAQTRTLLTGDVMGHALNPDGSLRDVGDQPDADWTVHAVGPSIDQVLAQRISGGDGRFRSIDLGVGVTGSGTYLYAGRNDPVSIQGDPRMALDRLFTGFDPGAIAEAERVRANRRSVLDGVLGSFRSLRGKVGREDRVRLDNHFDKIREIETRLEGDLRLCEPPTLDLYRPDWRTFDYFDHSWGRETFDPGFDPDIDIDVTAPAHAQVLALAMACDLTRVGSILFVDKNEIPYFRYGKTIPGSDTALVEGYSDWHDMVHGGQGDRENPGRGLVEGFKWYSELYAGLLTELESHPGTDPGTTLLDETMTMWTSEFSNGCFHNTHRIPFIFGGNVGPGGAGRHLNRGVGWVEDGWGLGENGDMRYGHGWEDSQHTQNQVFTSVLHAFGFDDERFGRRAPDIDDSGPIEGFGS